jgi:uncharacterized protein (TIGR02246 family)
MRVFVIALATLEVSAFASGQAACAAPCPAPVLSASQAATPAPSRTDPREAEIRAVDVELDRAFLWGDKEALAAILDGAMVSVGGFDDVTTREQILEQMRPRTSPPKSTITPSQVVVRFSGDSAVLTAKKTRTFEVNGRTNTSQYRDTNTYVRRDGRWKLVSSISSSEDPPYSAGDVSFDLDFDPSVALGDPKAPVVVYEFSDYECPFCRRFAAETFSRVEKDYVRTGRVAVVFRDNPLEVHPRAAAAAAAGACAESFGKRWPMTEKLLRDPVALSDEDLRRYAREIGLDGPAFDRCVADPATAAKIRRGSDEAFRMGIQGTPIFVIGVRAPGERKVHAVRKIAGAYPFEVFQATIDGILRVRAAS